MRLKRNIFLINTYTVFSNALFIVPVLLPYFRDQAGLGFKDLLLLEAVFAATLVALEVPSGWISDVWKRKHTMAVGVFLELIGLVIFMLAKDFTTFLFGEIFLGIGISLCSGTNSAIVYESLLSVGKTKQFSRLEGKRIALSLYAVAIAGIIGGLTYPIHHQLPIVLTISAMLIALIATCLLDEPERHKKMPEHHPVKDMLITIKYALHGHAEVAFIIFFSAALFCSTKLLMWTQQPYYIEMNIPEAWFGILMAVGFMIGGVSSHTSHLLDNKISNNKALTIFWAIVIAICILASIKISWFGVILLMFGGSAIFGLAKPRVSNAINNNVDSSRRATILSTQNLMVSLFYIPVSILMGFLSGAWGLQGVFVGLIIWLLIAGLFLGLLFIKNGKKNAS